MSTAINFLGDETCPFTFHGKRLLDMRRIELREVAQHFGLDSSGAKVDLIARIMKHKGYRVDSEPGRREIRFAPRELS